MTNGLYNSRLGMLLNLFNHGATFFSFAGINTNFHQFMCVQRNINFVEHIFGKAGTPDDHNHFTIVGEFA